MPGPLLAIDGPFVLYRSFFALPDSIKDADGHPVNALLGAVNLILRIAADRRPRAIVVCFGAEAATYRVELYPGYHAQRPPVPDALALAVRACDRAAGGLRVERACRTPTSKPTICSARWPRRRPPRAGGR